MKKLILFSLATLFAWSGCAFTQQKIKVKSATFNMRYDNPGDNLNSWKHRRERVCQFIEAKGLDIIGMQEVLHSQFRDLQKRLPQYDGVGVGRDDGKTAGEYAPIFYRKDKYELLDSNTFWLSENPQAVGKLGWDAACTRIATWAKFKEKKTGRVFMFVNTHFDHVGTTARRQSALLIIDKIKDIVGDQPAVLTGDFNVNDRSEAYETLTTNEFLLKDAYKIAEQVSGVTYTFHDFTRVPVAEREKIDFIFVTPQIKVLHSEIPAEESQALLSDHNPQIAELEF